MPRWLQETYKDKLHRLRELLNDMNGPVNISPATKARAYYEAREIVSELEDPNIIICNGQMLPINYQLRDIGATKALIGVLEVPNQVAHITMPYRGPYDYAYGRVTKEEDEQEATNYAAEEIRRRFSRYLSNLPVPIYEDTQEPYFGTTRHSTRALNPYNLDTEHYNRLILEEQAKQRLAENIRDIWMEDEDGR